MPENNFDLNSLSIAKPCTMSWDKMKGDTRTRHCDSCKMNVYNVAGLTREETMGLMKKAANGERVCMRLHRRSDGTIITKDCPIGVKIWRMTQLKIAALIGMLSTLGFWASSPTAEGRSIKLMGKVAGPSNSQVAVPVTPPIPTSDVMMGAPAMMGEPMLGDVYIPPTPPASPTPTPEIIDMADPKNQK